MPRELRCPLPDGIWSALAERAAATGEPVAHIVARALADALDVEHHTLFQVSTAGALVQGVYQGAARIATLREHGDFGLGTFEGLDGELVALDGGFLRARADGSVSEAPDDALSPYAMVTRLAPGPDADLGAVADLDALCAPRSTPCAHGQPLLRRPPRGRVRVPAPARRLPRARRHAAGRRGGPPERVAPGGRPRHGGRVLVAGLCRPPGRRGVPPALRRRRPAARPGTCSGLGGAGVRARVQRLDELVVALPETPGFLAADLRPDPGAALRRAERDDEP